MTKIAPVIHLQVDLITFIDIAFAAHNLPA